MKYSEKVFLTLDEAAIYLGIAKSTLYKLTACKLIPFSKPNGKKIYFSKIRLEEWVMSKSNNPDLEDSLAVTFVTTNS